MSWLISGGLKTPWAEGGTLTQITVGATTYRIHTFTNAGTSSLTVLNGGNFEYLIVAGGGSGGGALGFGAGGGGAGGMLTGTFATTANTNYDVVVGNGGIGPNNSSVKGADGENSSIFSLTAIGGGGGGCPTDRAGRPGGSGGGSSAGLGTAEFLGGSGTTGQGNKGGASSGGGTAAGGGGAGAAGVDGGAAGIGLQSSITGSSLYYAGGGSPDFRLGTLGGGGAGATLTVAAENGAPNTGGGGGGARGENATVRKAGNGGSGIVIVRYAIA